MSSLADVKIVLAPMLAGMNRGVMDGSTLYVAPEVYDLMQDNAETCNLVLKNLEVTILPHGNPLTRLALICLKIGQEVPVKAREDLARVIVISPMHGLTAMRVCAKSDATDEEILEVCNRENPSGTALGWCIVIHEHEEGNFKNCRPVQCNDYPDRSHFVVIC